MPEPIFDTDTQTADATPPPVPDTLTIGKTQDRLLPTQPSVDPLSADAYQRVVSGETSLYKKRIAEEERLARGESGASKAYDARLERMLHAEGATVDDLQPWNPQTMAPPPTNLWEKFGSPGFVIGMLASSFTGMPMVSALNAGAAAMNAINEGDDANYHRAFDTWKVNSELAIKRFNMEKDAFAQIEDLRRNNIEEWHAKATALAARFNDERMQVLLQNGMYPEAIKAQEALATSIKTIEDTKKAIEDNNVQRMIVNSQITDENGQLKPEYAKDPTKIAQAKTFAEQLMKMPQTPEQMVMYNLIRDPTFQSAGSEEQNKRIIQETAALSMAKAKGNIMQQEIERQWIEWDAENPGASIEQRTAARAKIAADVTTSFKPLEAAKIAESARYHDIQADVANKKITVQQGQAAEKQRHDEAVERIATGKLDQGEQKLAQDAAKEAEKERHAKETERISRLVAAGKLDVSQETADERTRHDQAMEAIAQGRIDTGNVLATERERHDRAVENIATMKFTPFENEVKAATDEWTTLRDGTPPTPEMTSLIRAAYQSKGNMGAARVAQVGNALAQIQRKKITDNKLPSDAEQEQILRNSLLQSTTTAPMTTEQLDALGWNAQAIDLAAETYNDTGKLPSNLGTRQVAANISGAIQNRAAQKLQEKYPDLTPEARAERRAQQWQLFSAQRVGIARFMSGPQGNTTRSLNVVVYHLKVMEDLSKALKNGEYTRFNAIAQQWAEETGSPIPTNFDTAKQIVGAEVIKALGVAGAGTAEERTQAADAFKRSRSPDAIEGSIGVMRNLLVGQLKGLRQQFTPATGLETKWFDSQLDPQTVDYLKVGNIMQSSKPPVPGAVLYKGNWYTRGPDGKPVPVQQ